MKQLLALLVLLVGFGAYASKTVVTSGTISKIVAAEKEIYVQAEGQKYEYYLNEKTAVTKAGTVLAFVDLKEGQKVKVTANKKGKHLTPLTIEVVE